MFAGATESCSIWVETLYFDAIEFGSYASRKPFHMYVLKDRKPM